MTCYSFFLLFLFCNIFLSQFGVRESYKNHGKCCHVGKRLPRSCDSLRAACRAPGDVRVGGQGVLELFLQVTPGDFTTAPLQSLSSTKHPGWRGQWQPRVQPWCSAVFGCDPIAGDCQVAEGPRQGSGGTGRGGWRDQWTHGCDGWWEQGLCLAPESLGQSWCHQAVPTQGLSPGRVSLCAETFIPGEQAANLQVCGQCTGSMGCRWPNPQPTSPQKDRPKTTRWLLGRWGASEGTERGGLSGVLLRDLLQWQEREEGSTQGYLLRVLSLQDRADMACLRPVCVTSPSSAAADIRDTMGDSHWTTLEHPMLL